MPGMMDTILNLGLGDEAAEGLAARTGNRRFALDSYRRLIQMFGEVVDGIDGHRFEDALAALKRERGAAHDTDLTADDLDELVETFRGIYREEKGAEFPQTATEQLMRAVRAVFDSWDTPRAQVYRRANEIPDDLGTAVNVVQMVFGNKGDRSGTGVAFTRDPSTGEKEVYGEFLANAQGEDVVAGHPHAAAGRGDGTRAAGGLRAAARDAAAARGALPRHAGRRVHGRGRRLYMLQTRAAKRTAAAALKAAVDMVDEGLISREEAVARIDPAQLDQLLHPMIDPDAAHDAGREGPQREPGRGERRDRLRRRHGGRAREGRPRDPRPLRDDARRHPRDDRREGILTVHGGMTSHAAVVARGMGKPCVAGCDGLDARAAASRGSAGTSCARAT